MNTLSNPALVLTTYACGVRHYFAYSLSGWLVAHAARPCEQAGFDLISRRLTANGYDIVSPNATIATAIRNAIKETRGVQ